jgi:hypothetical protein
MTSKHLLSLSIAVLLFSTAAESQVYISPGVQYYRVRPPRPVKRLQRPPVQPFEPAVELSLGYGFPNLDKNFLPYYYQAYYNYSSMTGPFTGVLNYRFSRSTAIGIMVTHGNVKSPYYSFGSGSPVPDFNVQLDNWAFMFNMVNYLPGSKTVSPYTRLAMGINSWQQYYTDALGNKIYMQPVYLPDFTYQASIGAIFKMSKNLGFFVEAGYGKYIIEGGLSFKL